MSAGVVSLGPMYLWYHMLGELKEKGVRTPLLAAFLYSRAVKIPMLPVMAHYFGLRMKHPGMIFLERKGSQGGLNP